MSAAIRGHGFRWGHDREGHYVTCSCGKWRSDARRLSTRQAEKLFELHKDSIRDQQPAVCPTCQRPLGEPESSLEPIIERMTNYPPMGSGASDDELELRNAIVGFGLELRRAITQSREKE